QLDDDVDVGCRGERQRVLLPAHTIEVDVALLGLGACAHGHKLEAPAAAQRQQAIVLGQQLDDASAYGAEAGDADLQWSSHGRLVQARALSGVMLSPTPRR